jgi:23S rRNA A2030 N6-methylase RlmJ
VRPGPKAFFHVELSVRLSEAPGSVKVSGFFIVIATWCLDKCRGRFFDVLGKMEGTAKVANWF